mgnify:CR=1 FL=1
MKCVKLLRNIWLKDDVKVYAKVEVKDGVRERQRL